MKLKKGIIIGTVLAVSAGIVTMSAQKSDDSAMLRNLNTFNSIVTELQLNYVDSLNPDRSFRQAIDAFLETVDPYTVYYGPDDQEALEKMTTGEYGGIGSYLGERDGYTFISGPMEDSPASRAGLKSGDRLLMVDTVDVSKMGSAKVTKLLRGTPETSVHVRVQRPYANDSILDFDIVRGKLRQPSVQYSTIKGNTGYIQLTQFIKSSPQEVKQVLEQFKADTRVKNLVLDLRSNGGGLLEGAVEIAGYFLPKGTEVVRTKGKESSDEKVYKTTHTPIMPDIPVVVLIDGGTASAAEILAGAMQDLDRAVLVGSRSFGKGLVQSTRPLPYDGLLKITVAKYYIPSGRLIQALDYSHRNEDGSVGRVPDSLTHVFKTLNGREVRDGGGLKPDSVVDWGKMNRLVYNLVRDNWTFDYATRFAAEHPTIAPASQFVITDSIYADFKRSIDPEKFHYDKVMEDGVKELREIATEEGYMSDETAQTFDALSKLLTHNLDKDLNTHREEIEDYLGEEIVGRYYYDAGKTAYTLRHDKGFDKAVEILSNPTLYNAILKKGNKK
jgi:carboxyl-terminal processing protease